MQSSQDPYSHLTSDPHTTEGDARPARNSDDEAAEEAPFAPFNPEEDLDNEEIDAEGDGEDLFEGNFEEYVAAIGGGLQADLAHRVANTVKAVPFIC